MKQVVQNYRNGRVRLAEVPVPVCDSHHVLVRTTQSLISLGTERSIIHLGKKSLLGKARARPDLVKRVVEKARNEGLRKTLQEAAGRLETPTPLGYSAAGVVIESGYSAECYSPKDRVAVIGQGIASHAEYLHVPVNMACQIPNNVSDESAAFGMLGTIALHGIRQSGCDFGSTVLIVGAGLLGLLSLLILKAYGCRVVVMDLVPEKVALAIQMGADFASTQVSKLKDYIDAVTHSFGVDACLITTATRSERPINTAVSLSRRGGRVVLVGTADIHPNRQALWEKECELLVSRAGGPGALDAVYEQQGIDLPIDIARWTPQRNLAEFMRLLSAKAIDVSSLISHHFPIEDAESVYAKIDQGNLNNSIGILFDYSEATPIHRSISISSARPATFENDTLNVSVIGAGIFAKSLLLPVLKKQPNIRLNTLVAASGASAEHSAKRFGFSTASTDSYAVFSDIHTQAVIGLAPHKLHADLVLKALQQNKSLLIEKPLCINLDELIAIETQAISLKEPPILQVGHNRRHSPHAKKIKSWLKNRQQPLVIQYRVNAGFISADHWVHSDAEGRSRIVGELSHFIDFMQFITDEVPQRVFAERVVGDERAQMSNDNIVVTFKFNRGSVATLTYSASGARGLPRELLEIFYEGKAIRLDNFLSSHYYSPEGNRVFRTRTQSLGYTEALQHFFDAVRGRSVPSVSLEIVLNTMRVVFSIESALSLGAPVCMF